MIRIRILNDHHAWILNELILHMDQDPERTSGSGWASCMHACMNMHDLGMNMHVLGKN